MNEKKVIIINLFWGVVSGCLSYIINFLLTPFITNKLGIEAYGYISLGNTIITYVNIISVGLNSFSARYIAVYYHKGDIEKANSYYSSILVANVVLALIIIIPSMFMIQKLECLINIVEPLQKDVKVLFLLILANYFVGLLGGVFSSVAFIKNRIGYISKVKGISVLIYAGLLLVSFYFFSIRVYLVAFCNLIASIIVFLANYYYSRKLIPELKFSMKFFSLYRLKDLLSAGVYNSINSLGGTLGSGLDLLITNLYLDSIKMGQIAVGNQIGAILNTIITMVANVFQPKQLEAYSKDDKESLVKYFIISMKTCGIVANVFWGCFLFIGESFFRLWIPMQDYEMIYRISLIVILGNLIVSIVTPLFYITTLTVRMKLVCFITLICGALNVISMILLLQSSYEGAFIVVGTTAVLDLVSLFVFPKITVKYLNLTESPFTKIIIQHFCCSVLLLGLYFMVPKFILINSWFGFIGECIILCVVMTLIVSAVQLNSSEKKTLISIIVEKIKHRSSGNAI